MNLHLAEIAATVAPAAHAIFVVDQAGWHMSTRLIVPANITIIPLPPKCPEFNPVENVWQFLRDNWLSNHVFKSYGSRRPLLRGFATGSSSKGSDHWDSVLLPMVRSRTAMISKLRGFRRPVRIILGAAGLYLNQGPV
jgi:hypothetical protein